MADDARHRGFADARLGRQRCRGFLLSTLIPIVARHRHVMHCRPRTTKTPASSVQRPAMHHQLLAQSGVAGVAGDAIDCLLHEHVHVHVVRLAPSQPTCTKPLASNPLAQMGARIMRVSQAHCRSGSLHWELAETSVWNARHCEPRSTARQLARLRGAFS